jgi:hypothetical protein
MNSITIIRIAAGILSLAIFALLIQRRCTRVR